MICVCLLVKWVNSWHHHMYSGCNSSCGCVWLTDSPLPITQVRRNNKVPLLSHTHVHQSFLHAWDYLVGSQDDVICLSIIISETNWVHFVGRGKEKMSTVLPSSTEWMENNEQKNKNECNSRDFPFSAVSAAHCACRGWRITERDLMWSGILSRHENYSQKSEVGNCLWPGKMSTWLRRWRYVISATQKISVILDIIYS